MNLGVISEELLDPTRLVGRQVVENDVDLCVFTLAGDDRSQEGHEVLAGVVLDRFPKNLSGARVEGGEEGQRAMAVVLETVSFETARAQWQHGVKPIERLDVGLLVNAKHRCVL